MTYEKIKPVPKYILKRIKKLDDSVPREKPGITRFYSYLTKNDGELVKVTVATKYKRNKWHYKQCAIHGLDSERCFVKDMLYGYMCHHVVGWFDEGLTTSRKWYEDPEWGWHYDKMFDPYAPCINKEYALKYKGFQYSAADKYEGQDIIQYLRIYRQYPHAEYMVKLGLSSYTHSKQIMQKLARDKKFRKWIGKNHEELSQQHFYISAILSAYKRNVPLAETQAYQEGLKTLNATGDYQPIRDMLHNQYAEYLRYIASHNISNRLYLDYLKACLYLGLDMEEPKNRFPHDFKYWHDVRIDQYKTKRAEADERERKELYAKFSMIAEKYAPMQKNSNSIYIAVIARSPAELIAEGEALSHCVGRMNYDQRVVREESLIFFIRNIDAPDTPLVTVEYSLRTKKILQCYAYHNQAPAEDIQNFVYKKWLPYANRQLKKIAA